MQLTHFLSDLLLAVIGIFVFFKFINKLNLQNTILWESFILSVVGAAIFGMISFAGYTEAFKFSEFFASLASLTGGVGLIAAAYGLVKDISYSRTTCYIILTLGFFIFVLAEAFGIKEVKMWVPVLAMGLVALFGIWALILGKISIGAWLIVAVGFFALAQFRTTIFGTGDQLVDIYHLLVAGGVFSLGLANHKPARA
jgi:hypothetical protein